MTTRIRLMRMGAKKRPFFRVVVADQRSPRDGRFIENIGMYHPLEDPSVIDIDEAKALDWLLKGAQPSQAVHVLLAKAGIWEKFEAEKPVRKATPAKTRKPAAKTRKPAAKKEKKAAP